MFDQSFCKTLPPLEQFWQKFDPAYDSGPESCFSKCTNFDPRRQGSTLFWTNIDSLDYICAQPNGLPLIDMEHRQRAAARPPAPSRPRATTRVLPHATSCTATCAARSPRRYPRGALAAPPSALPPFTQPQPTHWHLHTACARRRLRALPFELPQSACMLHTLSYVLAPRPILRTRATPQSTLVRSAAQRTRTTHARRMAGYARAPRCRPPHFPARPSCLLTRPTLLPALEFGCTV